MLRPAIFPLSLWAVIALTTTIGCGSAGPNQDSLADLLIRTDKPAYSKSLDSGVRITLVNQGAFQVYAPMGEYVHIEQWSENGWINRGPWFFVDGIGSLQVPPGDSLIPLPMNLDYIDRAGTYRFIFQLAFDPHGRRLIPGDERVSNEFQVTW